MAITTRPRGTNDILPAKIGIWHKIEDTIRRICHQFGYEEIRTPIFEHTELFERGIGEATDIVEKEMYTFTDRGQRSITLRPEGTAPVVRAFLENKLYGGTLPAKVYYVGPMFRYERPQAGRYRQFNQFGIEALGGADPALDVEMILIPIEVYKAVGLKDFEVQINSIGCPSCRTAYREALKDSLRENIHKFCPSCQSRFDKNPLRILDCKVKECIELTKDVPVLVDYLCTDCSEHFSKVKEYLDALNINYSLNNRLVRGFDYYTRTVFEIISVGLGSQNAVGGGGRYDGLIEEVGGQPHPAVGFAAGLERLVLALENQNMEVADQRTPDCYIAQFGGQTKTEAVKLAYELRQAGLWAEFDYMEKSLRAQMKAADKFGAKFVIVIGEEEIASNQVKVRSMVTGQEELVSLGDIKEYLIGHGGEKDGSMEANS